MQVDVDEPLVVPEVEVGLGAVVEDEHLAVLERVHRAGVDVDVRVELLDGDLQSAGLEEAAEGGGGDALAETGGDSPGDEDELRLLPHHGTRLYQRPPTRRAVGVGFLVARATFSPDASAQAPGLDPLGLGQELLGVALGGLAIRRDRRASARAPRPARGRRAPRSWRCPSSLLTRTCRSAKQAICGRCVTTRTWRSRASRASRRPTASPARPPIPASTSSKTSVGTSSRSARTLRHASIVRESSPPDAAFASGSGRLPGPRRRTGARRARRPTGPGSGSASRATSSAAPGIPSSSSSVADRRGRGRARPSRRPRLTVAARSPAVGLERLDLGRELGEPVVGGRSGS